jgi:undecaprenyl-diphosphatase
MNMSFFDWLPSTHELQLQLQAIQTSAPEHALGSLLALVFIIAFLESFAVAGVLVPGVMLLSLCSAAIGTAMPSNIALIAMLIAGFAGAFAGDQISYQLGKIYHHNIRHHRPFSTHPQWIDKGERFFLRYGYISILSGRFIGPVRPFIPLIAGMFQMPFKAFFTINLLSAALWSPVYLLPGYLAARLALSP